MRHTLIAAVLLTGCQATWPYQARVLSPSGQQLCAKHRVPLVTARAFQAPTHGDMVHLVHDGRLKYGIFDYNFPNHYPQGASPHRWWILTEPTTVKYCKLCESEFSDALRIKDEAEAILWADWEVGFRGWTTVENIGPHRVTFEHETWTVICSLPDGGMAVIRIKEVGFIDSAKGIAAKSPNQAREPTVSADQSNRRLRACLRLTGRSVWVVRPPRYLDANHRSALSLGDDLARAKTYSSLHKSARNRVEGFDRSSTVDCEMPCLFVGSSPSRSRVG